MTTVAGTIKPRLLPCPFCGEEAEIIHIENGENAGGSCVCCTGCMASGHVEFGFKENFVRAWNRRATPANATDTDGLVESAEEQDKRRTVEYYRYQWKHTQEQFAALQASIDRANAANEALAEDAAALRAENEQVKSDLQFMVGMRNKWHDAAQVARAERDRLQEEMCRIVQWSEAYPLSVFPEPDMARAAQALKAAGITLDAISASNMRHVIEGVGRIARAALDAQKETE